jgi:hypothetical protein
MTFPTVSNIQYNQLTEHGHVPQRFKIGSDISGILGVTALKASFLYGALINTFFREDTTATDTKFDKFQD